MNQIDITIKKVCDVCGVEIELHRHYPASLMALSEHPTLTLKIPDAFINCPCCGLPPYLRNQAQPHDIRNHIDIPTIVDMTQQEDQT